MRLTPLEPWIAGLIGQPGRPLDRAALADYQLERLRVTLDLARAHSPFYRAHLANAPARLDTLADLAALPFTTAAEVREHALRMVCVSQGEIARVVTLDSSGTSGPPKRLYFTLADQALTVDFFAVGMSTFTGSGDRVLILLPGATPGSVGALLATALERLGAVPIPHGLVSDPAEALALAATAGATVAVGLPTQVLRLARTTPRPTGLRLHSVLLTTDHVPQSLARAVEAAFECRVYNHYGMTEMGLGGGVDCAARRGYHLREADLYGEIVDPLTGTAVPEGEAGELVVTTLTRTGLPLIRYRTGDLARWRPDPCPCGTHLRTLAHITTRVAGQVEVGGHAPLTLALLDEALFALPGVVDFEARLQPTGDGLELQLTLQASGAGPDLAEAATRAVQAVAAGGGATRLRLAPVQVVAPPALLRYTGKRCLPISPQ